MLSTGFGCYTRPAVPNVTAGKDQVISVANQTGLNNALATIAANPNTSYAVSLANGTYTNPDINGWNGTGDVSFFAATPGGATFVPGGADAFRIWDTTRPVELVGINVDGQGTATWGLVVGGSFVGDPKSGKVENFRFSHGEIHSVEQEPVRIAASSETIVFEHLDIHSSGLGAQQDFGELFYVGQGGDDSDQPRDITLRGAHLYNGRFGEAIDIKVGARDVLIEDVLVSDITAKFGGAITLAVDDSDGGHNASVNYTVRRVHIENVRPSPNAFTQSIEGIEVGGGYTLIENVTITDIQGRGINAVRQFAGPNDVVEVRHVTITDTTGATLELNTEAPNGGNNPGTMTLCNVLTDDGAMGSTQYTSGFVGTGSDGLQFQLAAGSPHVDAGVSCGTTEDFCGNPRPQGSAPDVGAFEFLQNEPLDPLDPTVTSGDCTASPFTDTNGDQWVEVADGGTSTFYDPAGVQGVPS